MARYDRIAPLPAPPRKRAFCGWLVLRDLEGRERDAELARRARLRYLALRPVRRLAQHGIENVPPESFERQVDGVREELGHLPARDAERAQIARFLHKIRQRTPLAITTATLDLGELAEAAKHYFAAEEYYLTALDFADAYRLAPEQVIALRLLGRVFRKTTAWDDAERSYRRAAEIALRLDDRHQWGRAMDGLGLVHRRLERYGEAVRVYETVVDRGREWDNDRVFLTGLHGLALTGLDAGDPERALEHGWAAFGRATDPDDRTQLLATLAEAFACLGLRAAAERCLILIINGSRKALDKARARLHLASIAAADDRIDTARDHLREAMRLAKEQDHGDILVRAGELLGQLEAAASHGGTAAPRQQPGDAARRIATEIESIGEIPVPASS